jgi:hypothetical protein
MGLLTRERLSAQMQTLAQLRERLFPFCARHAGPQDLIQALNNKLFQRGPALRGRDFCPMEKILGQIERGFHNGNKTPKRRNRFRRGASWAKRPGYSNEV